MTEKVLLDTDIGTDIDDALCLAYLLSNPACELLGITTVTGEPERRAQMASVICHAAGRADIPIYPGTSRPMLVEQRQLIATQAEVVDRWPHATQFPQGQALEFLRQTIRAHPGEITLLTIGPLTNIGLLFAADPEIPGLLKRLVLMAGLFTNQVTGFGPLEWNAFGDPHASAVVYRAPVPVHRSVGLDVTTRVVMSAEEARARLKGPVLAPVLDFAEIWFRQWGGIMFHDPLAATTIFNESICRFEPGLVEIELDSPRLAGFTHWTGKTGGPHQVALQVDPERFFQEFFAYFEPLRHYSYGYGRLHRP
jgi:inosine-uridine nucleoside N-ribohydrolase